jgi:hypothetical protein
MTEEAQLLEVLKYEGIPRLWAMGRLDWKLRPHQRPIYEAMDLPGNKIALECAKRFGKTFTAILRGIEKCSQKKYIIRYFAATQEDAAEIAIPTIESIIADCPAHLKPKLNVGKSRYDFPNGSVFYITGCDNKRDIDRHRGKYADEYIIDEAGFNRNLKYLYRSVIASQFLDSPNCKVIIISSTSEMPDHYFFVLYAEADAKGHARTFTIDHNTWLTPEQRKKAIDEAGGIDSIEARREYFCCRDADPETMILYAFDEAKHVGIIPRDDNYKHWHKYVSCDWGTADSTFGVFGVYIRDLQLLYIEDEFEVSGVQANTSIVSGLLYQKRAELGHEFGWDKPYRQVGDNDLRAIGDLNQIYGHQFTGITKDRSHEQGFKEACVDSANYQLQSNRILIHPRCERLIKQCRNGLWKKKPVEFARIEGFGHFDGIDALIYLNRMVDRTSNPVPIQQSHDPLMRHIIKEQAGYYEKQEQMNKIFGRNFGEKENDTSFL